ncbi:peptidylprolyl isomerase [Salininema proteolyticum]|uniref:Peptidyl-prolyl cis-trans isomerase n=1 Tax=Salininema proteolyticum TaxID=1607685 RepID=A0ABV8TVQ9_9ACTN
MTDVTLHTNKGDINLELFDLQAPKTVKNFVGLAEGTQEYTDSETGEKKTGPYYNGVIFHRVIDGFMIQGGDPTGTGAGGPGYEFNDEISPDLHFGEKHLLAMANRGPGTNGSQFFITLGPTPHLNGRHTIFGKVSDDASRQVVDAIGSTQTGAQDRPVQDIAIQSVTVKHS